MIESFSMAPGAQSKRRAGTHHPYRAAPPAPPIERSRSNVGLAIGVALVTWLVVLVAGGSIGVLAGALALLVPVIAKPLSR